MNQMITFQQVKAMLICFSLTLIIQDIHAQIQHSSNSEKLLWMENSSSKGMHEIPAMRDRFSKHYQMQNGQYKMISSVSPIHYLSSNGWVDINNNIELVKGGKYDSHPYFNDGNCFVTKYPSQILHNAIITTLAEGEMKESIEAVYATDILGANIYAYTSNACQAVEFSDATIQYKSVFPNSSVKYTQLSVGRRFDFILQNEQFIHSLPSQAENLIIKEKLVIPSSWSIRKSENGYEIYQGESWLTHIEIPFATDANNETINGALNVEQHGQEVIMYTSFPLDWLKNTQRQYPITLDPTITVYPPNSVFATGNMTSLTGAKTSGNIRLANAGAIAWAKFSLASLPSGSILSEGHYHGYHFNGVATTNKIAAIIGMQTIDPLTATNTQINSQITSSGPTYDANYIFGGLTVPVWHIDTLNATALTDIAAQQTQGWTAFGFRYLSGNTSTQIQYGYNSLPSNQPYLELMYTVPPCSGTPSPGNTLASTTLPCLTTPVHLSVQNNFSLGSGITYQWYNTGGAITGATDSTYDALVGSTGASFWCEVTCTSSSATASSTPIAISGSNLFNCYCVSTATAFQDEDIYNVTVNGNSTNTTYSNANNCLNVAPGTGSQLNKYSNFTPLGNLSTIAQGMSSTFEVRVNECDGPTYFANGVGIWIDYNQNGSFNDPGEAVYIQSTGTSASGISPAGDKVVSGTFIVPATATLGQTMMRVICAEGFSGGGLNPCLVYAYGETEDYLVNIISSTCSGTPNPGNTVATLTSVCSGLTTNLSLQNVLGGGISYQWYNNAGAISGATNSTYTATITANDSFYCATTCIASGITSNSNPIYIQVAMPVSTISTEMACDSYIWGSAIITMSGTYTGTFTSAAGCDSIHTLNLTIHQSSSSATFITGCDSVMFAGQVYYSSGNYSQLFTNAAGCDSIVNISITVNYSDIMVDTLVGCDSVYFNGVYYTSNGTQTATFSNGAGCDSTVIATIMIIPGSTTTITQSGCNFYLFNGVMYTTSGLYTQSFLNAVGCDSIVYLNLTINASTDSMVNAVSCNGYTFNGQTYTTTGVYTQTYLNSVGCDSIVTLNVSIDTLNATITVNGITITTPTIGSYQWMNCDSNAIIPGATSLNFMPTSAGSYAVIVTTSTCVDTSICVPFIMTSTQDILENNVASIYPNPNHGHFELNLNEKATVFIMNNMGEIVAHTDYKKGTHQIDISSFASGIYFVKIKADNSSEIIKVVKE